MIVKKLAEIILTVAGMIGKSEYDVIVIADGKPIFLNGYELNIEKKVFYLYGTSGQSCQG